MISATVFFTILFPLMLVLTIVLDVAGRDLTGAPRRSVTGRGCFEGGGSDATDDRER
jgi:hypothetical protein